MKRCDNMGANFSFDAFKKRKPSDYSDFLDDDFDYEYSDEFFYDDNYIDDDFYDM